MDTVGSYRLLRQIGEGGMGVVHLALAPDGSRVAVKILRPQVIGDREARQRLEREVAAMRRVRSPRVADCLDAEPWGSPPYIVTRYVAGLSLTEYVAEYGPLEPDRLLRFATGTAEALAEVHAAAVLHRDVKPSNVLINRDQPVLIDFGLAMSGDESRMTHAGWVFGTPAYLAPEVVLGDAPTPAVDVHGWAATVTFAATGRSPYGSGPSVVVLDRIRRGDYTLAGVGEPLRSILQRCLDPQPHQRPTTPELCRWLHQVAGKGAAHPMSPSGTAGYPVGARPVGERPVGGRPVDGGPVGGTPAGRPVGGVSVGAAAATVSAPSAASMRSVGHPLGQPAAAAPGAGRTLSTPVHPNPGGLTGWHPDSAGAHHGSAGSPTGSAGAHPGSLAGPQTGPGGQHLGRSSPGYHLEHHQGTDASRGQVSAWSAMPSAEWPTGRPSAGARVLQWTAGLATAVALAGALAIAPYLATALVLVLLIGVRASFATADRRRRLAMRRGPRGRDGFVGFLMWPMRALWAAPVAVVACAISLASAMAISSLQTLAADTSRDASTVLGGLAFAALTWWGPAHFTLRRIGDSAAQAVLTPPVVGVLTASLLTVAALILLVIANDSPTWWAPFGESPWSWMRSQ